MITYLITGITVVVSFICFNNRLLFDKLSLKPYRIVHAKEWYRIISHGFVHADWVHLFVNMFTFWSFGKYIEETFRYLGFGEGAFLLLYFGGMVVASASDVIRYRNAAWYTSIGASGFCRFIHSHIPESVGQNSAFCRNSHSRYSVRPSLFSLLPIYGPPGK